MNGPSRLTSFSSTSLDSVQMNMCVWCLLFGDLRVLVSNECAGDKCNPSAHHFPTGRAKGRVACVVRACSRVRVTIVCASVPLPSLLLADDE